MSNMAYYPHASTYGAFQPQYPPQYPPQAQYSPQYQGSAPGLPLYPPGHGPVRQSTPPPEPHAAPELSAITPELASVALRRFLSLELQYAGYDSVQSPAFRRLELEVAACPLAFEVVECVYERAHEYANLANRTTPIATDLVLASEDYGLQTKDLHKLASKNKDRAQDVAALTLFPSPSRSPSPDLLPSDDEETPVIPPTLRSLPWSERHLPTLPPKHTYLRTPISPPKKAALPSLERKLKTAGLVQESLKNLLLATEDSPDQEDGEILGAIVNWESTIHPRKRWKLSS
ncbi:uncharacterized protein FIBRA_04919 [Fibroporia radiculosa]|uniref:Transcription factor TFIID subunit 8 C-terminal domain-containing protein n=1 Tax=Fibroporia radiculosa TaxID=599839 RepID=J4G861_9APHY|nr:uncharacterized protein FIBRA_04919 [Fibroporia radiculosa]CCM02808.1 predicted protein [Fibroporia radiculosa]